MHLQRTNHWGKNMILQSYMRWTSIQTICTIKLTIFVPEGSHDGVTQTFPRLFSLCCCKELQKTSRAAHSRESREEYVPAQRTAQWTMVKMKCNPIFLVVLSCAVYQVTASTPVQHSSLNMECWNKAVTKAILQSIFCRRAHIHLLGKWPCYFPETATMNLGLHTSKQDIILPVFSPSLASASNKHCIL